MLLLADQGVCGIIAGSNYRFGYKAAGDAALLQELGSKHGLVVEIVDIVMSSDVMHGQMKRVRRSDDFIRDTTAFALFSSRSGCRALSSSACSPANLKLGCGCRHRFRPRASASASPWVTWTRQRRSLGGVTARCSHRPRRVPLAA